MKLLVAVIKPFKLDAVRQALLDIGIGGMTVTEGNGFGRQRGHTEVYRSAEYQIDFLPKLRIDLALEDEAVDGACATILAAAQTGKLGDGKLFVFDLVDVVRIRTNEHGSAAL